MIGRDQVFSSPWISGSAGSITTRTFVGESKQFRPRRHDAPAHGRPAPDAPDVAPVANSPTGVLSVLSVTQCRSRSSAGIARALYKFQRSGELSEPRGSPTIDGRARQAGALAPQVRVALDQPAG